MPKHNLLISGICSAIVFFGLLVSLQVFQATRSINNDTMELVDKKIPLLKEIEKLKQVITERERILYEYYATTDQSAAHKSLREVEILIDLYIADLKVLLPNNTEINTFDSLNNSIFAVTRELDANLGKRQGKNWDLAREQLEAITAYGRQIHPALDMLEQAATAAADEQRELTIEQGENMKLSILAYAFVICLIALGVAYISSRYLITAEEKRKAHEKLSFLATHDEELGIANRNQLEIDVNSAEHQDITAIVLLKLDNIERYSNSYGFPFVEQLIQHASNRLKQEDFDGELYRFNDSTLALLLNGDFRQASEPLASQLQNLFSSPVDTSEGPFYLSLSMGYVRCSEANYEFSTLIKYAETALTKSIISGGKTMSTFTKDMYSQEKYRFAMEQELQNAVENNELHLFYQAKVGANDNTTIGYEALIRWKRNQSEWVPPFEFIPLAEQSGQILEIGSWVIQEACKQIKLWREQGFENFTIAVNISPRQFQHHAFLSTLVNIVEEAEIPPACLELEITESLILQDADSVLKTLKDIKDLGFGLALDDFGTGYSSLSYLTDFPVDKLKIDKTFIDGLSISKQSEAVVQSIIDLAHNLNLSVVAEGVESDVQLSLLKQYGCEEIQGYLFSKPLPSEEAVEFLSHRRRLLSVG